MPTVPFEEYVAARRSTLVRTAVLLGCSSADAEDAVQTMLLRCFRSWRRVSRGPSASTPTSIGSSSTCCTTVVRAAGAARCRPAIRQKAPSTTSTSLSG